MPKEIESKTYIQDILGMLRKEETDHMHRVGILAKLLSEKAYLLGIYKGDTVWEGYKHFGEAAFYHDIGKAWIPKELLDKHGKPTRQEELILHLHPVFARILFENLGDDLAFGVPKHLLSQAFQAAIYHHERWDGKGYPYKVENAAIPLIARITAICDAYDAITSMRTYKEAQSHNIACRELQENAGTQFDPQLVMAFLENEKEFSLLNERQAFNASSLICC